MPRLVSGSLLFALACAFVTPARAAEERTFAQAKSGKGELRYVEGVPVLFLEGNPEEIGKQAGTLVGPATKPLLGLPRQILADRESVVGWTVVATLAEGLVNHAPVRYRREIDAACKAAELTPDERNAYLVANAMVELRRMGGCSAVLVEPDRSATGQMLFGRNFDFPTFGRLDKLGLVSVVRPAGKKAFVSVGFPALTGVVSGMNEDGLAVATLDVYSSKDASPMFDPLGVPLALTYRQVLEECSTVGEAEALLKSIRHTTWMNLAACDTKRAVVFEITPKGVVTRAAEQAPLVCTNHFRSPQLCTSKTCGRFDAITATVGGKERVGLPDVQKALHAANQGDLTIQSMIFEPEGRVLHVALGSPPVTARPMTRLDLKPLLRQAASDGR